MSDLFYQKQFNIKKRPFTSIILPLYKENEYLKNAIGSIIKQTITDFELIIISEDIDKDTQILLDKYSSEDKRVVVIKRQRQGLASSLNYAISIAQGNFIARMDADDIAVPERISKQIDFINSHQGCDIVCSYITCIDEDGNTIGEWEIDRKTIQPETIKNTLVHENCIAHSTIFTRREIFLRYTYDPLDRDAEDYGLWLRLVSDGYTICKIPEPLLYYRIHKESVTALSKSKNPYKKVLNVKIRFLKEKICQGRFSFFECRVALFLLNDLIFYVKYWLYKE